VIESHVDSRHAVSKRAQLEAELRIIHGQKEWIQQQLISYHWMNGKVFVSIFQRRSYFLTLIASR
jgi:hypothetical protein